MDSPQAEAQSSSRVQLVIFWLVVGLPLLWGVEQTVKKALALFN